jgi:hypothetical protein
MKTNNTGFDRKAMAIAVALVLSMAAGVQAQDSGTPTPPERLIPWQSQASFGMVGLTINQTARLNVAWVTAGCLLDPRVLASNLVPDVPVHFLFLDGRGNTIARQTVPLSPGQAGALDLVGNSIPADRFRGPRASIRAQALLPAVPFRLLRLCLAASGTPPSDAPEPGISGLITVYPGPFAPIIRPYLYPYPPVDSSFQLTVEIFDSATGETKLILENPSILNGISWPLAITAPDGSSDGGSGFAPRAP